MKTQRISTLIFSLLIIIAGMSSCKKDDVPEVDALIGTWDLSAGTATGFESGQEFVTLTLGTSGTFSFKEEGTGNVNAVLTIAGDETDLKGSFEWVRENNSIVVSMADGTVETWVIESQSTSEQVFSYSEVDNDDPNIEIKITLTLNKQ